MHVIGCLEKINEEEPLVLQHNLLQIVVPAVLGSAASTNKYAHLFHIIDFIVDHFCFYFSF